jgi:hypothetical protein
MSPAAWQTTSDCYTLEHGNADPWYSVPGVPSDPDRHELETILPHLEGLQR